MQQNVGALDSTIRVALGFALLGVAFLVEEPMKWLAYAGFVALAVSGFVGKCPLYRLFGFSTRESSPST